MTSDQTNKTSERPLAVIIWYWSHITVLSYIRLSADNMRIILIVKRGSKHSSLNKNISVSSMEKVMKQVCFGNISCYTVLRA